MTPLLLLAYAVVLVVVAGPRLARAGWVARSPRLGIFAWQMWCAALLACALLTGVSSILHWGHAHDVACRAWRVCLDALLGGHGPAAQVAAGCGAVLLVTLAVRLTLAAWRLTGAERRQRGRLRQLMRLTGQPLPELGAVVVPAAQPAAYLLPGGDERDVVLTSAALQHLTGEELRAVAAHERAHATGRHYRLLRTVRLLDGAFPWASCFATAVRQMRRLVELRADDVAVRTHPPIVLARALVALAEARARQSAAGPGRAWPEGDDPGPLLAAHGGDTAERLHRLLNRPRPLPAALTRAAAVLFTLLPVTPIVIAVVQRSPLAP
ncbi:M56 family metallopeptidase [Dactylosporangium salmoneum]|uniref:Peptidase M48 domain-containing protein n=1 Tax=Dactylosporangium salmoneum TaxID=53361 RepID=A0ABN3FYL7_9ACTN